MRAVEPPSQIVAEGVEVKVGRALTVTGRVAAAVHPVEVVVPVRVYPWTPLRMTALAVTLLPVEADKPAAGDQV